VKTTLIGVVLAVVLCAAPVLAQDDSGPYLRLGFGSSDSDRENGTGDRGEVVRRSFASALLIDAAVGWRLGDSALRLEAEVLRLQRDTNTHFGNPRGTDDFAEGEVEAVAGMGVAYWDFRRGKLVQPYLGAGAGVANVDESFAFQFAPPRDADLSETILAYSAKAGVRIGLNRRFDYGIGYRFFATEDREDLSRAGGVLPIDGLEIHLLEVDLGIRF
jgi:opacity protein-like surface antigen